MNVSEILSTDHLSISKAIDISYVNLDNSLTSDVHEKRKNAKNSNNPNYCSTDDEKYLINVEEMHFQVIEMLKKLKTNERNDNDFIQNKTINNLT